MVEFVDIERFKVLRGKEAILIAETKSSASEGYIHLDFNVEYPLEDEGEVTPVKLYANPGDVQADLLGLKLIQYAKEHRAPFVYIAKAQTE
jgi:hypothetical protein